MPTTPTKTPLADGGYVQTFVDDQSISHAQKFTGSGLPVGPEYTESGGAFEATALSNGGYLLDFLQPAAGASLLRGRVFDTLGVKLNSDFELSTNGQFDIAAAPGGGFAVAWDFGGRFATPEPSLAVFNNSGDRLATAPVAGTTPTVTVLSNGHYQFAWTSDSGVQRTLEVDPASPSNLGPPPTPSSVGVDDAGPVTGAFHSGDHIDDSTPVMRVAVSQTGELDQYFTSGSQRGPTTGVTVTADDVARGYVDLHLDKGSPLRDGAYDAHAYLTGTNGVVSQETVLTFVVDTQAAGGSGTVQTGHDGGSNMTGGSGADTLIGGTSGPDTMTGGAGGDHFQFNTVPWQAATIADFTHGADKIDVSRLLSGVGYSGSDPIGDGYIKFGDDGQGNTWVYFDRDGHGSADQWGTRVATLSHVSASSLTASDWIFQSGGVSPPPPPPPPPPGGVVRTGQDGGSNLVGGSGDDTLIGGHGQDTMTGAGGADHFTWNDLPWAFAHITDFTHGADRIDVAHLLSQVGYAGSDPIADGYIKFGDDGQGNTWVYFDRDGAGTADQWGTHLATLDHLSAATLSGSDFIFH